MLGGGGAVPDIIGGLAEAGLMASCGAVIGLVAAEVSKGGGGGMVPTTGDDIIGGTMGITLAADDTKSSVCRF